MSNAKYDVLIVGAGAADCAVAAVRMVRKIIAQPSLASVVLDEVEPGPHLQSDHDIGE